MILFAFAGLGLLIILSQNAGGALNTNFDDLFKNMATKYGLDWKMLKAIAIIESSLGAHPSVKIGLENPSNVEGSKSSDGKSWGLMQVTIPTARDYDKLVTPEKLNIPYYSVEIASKHLAMLKKLFNGDVQKIVKSYNQGQGNTLAGKTYADGYWTKYLNAYRSIN